MSWPQGTSTISRKQRHRGRAVACVGVLLLTLIGAALIYQYRRPVPSLATSLPAPTATAIAGSPIQLTQPSSGAAAVSVEGLGTLTVAGATTPRPMASTTKLMTAFLILHDHPLLQGEQGPSVQVVPADVTSYLREQQDGQSILPVVAGEQLTEYQMLQALLLPSSNNIAELLARWDAGSLAAFVAKMNAEAAALGMAHTHYADASGNSPQSVGTPEDLITIANADLQNPIFAAIVSQSHAVLPVAGMVYNVDQVLGQDGIVGVKTGWTEEAGGCFVFAALQQTAGGQIAIRGAVMGEPTLARAFARAKQLITTVSGGVRTARVLDTNQIVAVVQAPWGQSTTVVPAKPIDLLALPGTPLRQQVHLAPLHTPLLPGQQVGTITVQAGPQVAQVSLVATGPITPPSALWRLTRGFHP